MDGLFAIGFWLGMITCGMWYAISYWLPRFLYELVGIRRALEREAERRDNLLRRRTYETTATDELEDRSSSGANGRSDGILSVPTHVDLFEMGMGRIRAFLDASRLPLPTVTVVPKSSWDFDACAYWRPETELNCKWGSPGINICLEKCARIARDEYSSNWNWPGCTVDRTPYGVLAHEVGHYLDYESSGEKGAYFGNFSIEARQLSGEPPLTSYCPNDAEWFAEMARLFITNPALLALVRPRTYRILSEVWGVMLDGSWLDVVGPDIPARIRKSQEKKMVRGER